MAPPHPFHHPLSPYAVQHEFMTALHADLTAGGVGIFESPTGVSALVRRRRCADDQERCDEG